MRAPLRPAPATAAVLETVRESVPSLDEDRPLAPDMNEAHALVSRGALRDAATKVAPGLR